MNAVLLDTHAWAWGLHASERLSPRARRAIEQAERVLLSPISGFEVAQKVRLGKWPEMAKVAHRLPEMLEVQGIELAPLGFATCHMAGLLTWAHRDPFDRLIAATASALEVPLVSADTCFDGMVHRIW